MGLAYLVSELIKSIVKRVVLLSVPVAAENLTC